MTLKIGIVAPCPVPYQNGGAERLWRGLRDHFNAQTTHQADIIKLPVREESFWDLIEGYKAFCALDLSGFDVVISGKYPAWMIDHPRHILYMLHPCRGLYEGYSGAPYGDADLRDPLAQKLVRTIRRRWGDRSALDDVFSQLADIRARPDASEIIPWVGPLAQETIQFLDSIGLHPSRIERYCAISGQLGLRPGYFPPGIKPAVAYPPSGLHLTPRGDGGYVFTSSRLEGYKRVDLLIEAALLSRHPWPLKIAGIGPDRERLSRLCKGSSRIEMLGYCSDSQMAAYYENATAIGFVPYQEDLGLVALEAMAAGKPLITTSDSGGPAELVGDGRRGYVVEAAAQPLADAFDQIIDMPETAQEKARAGLLFSTSVNWKNVVSTLLPAGQPRTTRQTVPIWGTRGVPRMVVVSTYSVFPPRHGGQSRIFHLYSNLARWFDITVVAIVSPNEPESIREIAPGLRQRIVHKSKAHLKQELNLASQVGVPIDDLSVLAFWESSPAIAQTLKKECEGAVAAIAAHPYGYRALRAACDCAILYEAQDIAVDIKRQIYPENRHKDKWIALIRETEKEVCNAASLIFACSEADVRTLADEYQVEAEKCCVVPNGTDLNTLLYRDQAARLSLRRRLFSQPVSTRMTFFMGSGHQPNLEAVKKIFAYASQLPEIAFLVAGSCCYAFSPDHKPTNVWFLGELSESEKLVTLELADIAINPLAAGSGTSLKMLDYMASGLPTVSTETGARGLGLVVCEHYVPADLDTFPKAISEMLENAPKKARIAACARQFVADRYGWQGIAHDFHERLIEIDLAT